MIQILAQNHIIIKYSLSMSLLKNIIVVVSQSILEYRICGNHGCNIYAKTSRGVRASNFNMNGINIQNEVFRWMDLLIIDTINTDHNKQFLQKKLH